jgi:hypothetical protein
MLSYLKSFSFTLSFDLSLFPSSVLSFLLSFFHSFTYVTVNYMKKLLLLLAIIPLALISAGCSNEPVSPLPEGEQTVTGVLELTELSFVRRGTHMLYMDGVPVYYVESKVVNLSAHEGKSVELIGTLERNTNVNDTPVLVVTSLKSNKEKMVEWKVPGSKIKFAVPSEIHGVRSSSELHFFVGESSKPVLTVYSQKDSPLPKGIGITVDGEQAVRVINEELNAESVYIGDNKSYVVFMFTPREDSDLLELRSIWLSLLRSIELSGVINNIPDPGLTGTGSVIPCGGLAGVLCPAGYYCEVTDITEGYGRCRVMR